jgi:hypothetical protein
VNPKRKAARRKKKKNSTQNYMIGNLVFSDVVKCLVLRPEAS